MNGEDKKGLGIYYFYKKIDRRKKISLEKMINGKNNLINIFSENELEYLNEKIPVKLPITTDDLLDKYNKLKELKKKLKGKKAFLYDICYLIVPLNSDEEVVEQHIEEIKNLKGFVKFLNSEDMKKEKLNGNIEYDFIEE